MRSEIVSGAVLVDKAQPIPSQLQKEWEIEMVRFITVALIALLLSACGDSSPGPLAGTWQVTGVMPMKVTFRDSETEALGIIEKVGYKVDGKSVLVTYKDGLMKGSAVRFVFINPTTAQAVGMTYRKMGR